ncbi:MAG: Ig domain-containing protein, partial [Acidobacteriota bacterium]
MNSKVLPVAVAVAAILIFAGNYYVSLGAECGRPTEPCKCRVRLVGAKQWGAAAASCSVKLGFAPDALSSDLVDCDIVEPGWFDRVVMCDQGVRATLYCGDSTVSVPAGGNVRLSCKSDARNRDRLWVNGKDTWVNTVQVPNAAYRAGPQRAAAADAPREAEFITDTVRVRVIDGAAGLERGASSGEQMLLVASGEAELESLCTGETVAVKGPGTAGVPRPAERSDYCDSKPPPAEPLECSRLDAVGRWRGVYALIQRGQPRRTVSFVLNIRSESGRLVGTLETPAATFPIAEARLSGSSLTLRATSERYGQVNLDGQVARGDIAFNVIHRDTTVSPAVGLSGVGSAGRLYIASAALPPATVGQPYSYELVALSPSRGAITYRLAEGSLPAGLTLDERAGTFSGAPAAAGESRFVVRVTDTRGDTSDQRFTLTVKKLAVTTTLLPDGLAGQRYSTTLKAAGGRPPYRW